jgi:hypothetical protein
MSNKVHISADIYSWGKRVHVSCDVVAAATVEHIGLGIQEENKTEEGVDWVRGNPSWFGTLDKGKTQI